MTLPELRALTGYWRQRPPVHVAVAAYLGLNKAEAPKRQLTDGDLSQVTSLFGQSRGTYKPPARWQH